MQLQKLTETPPQLSLTRMRTAGSQDWLHTAGVSPRSPQASPTCWQAQVPHHRGTEGAGGRKCPITSCPAGPGCALILFSAPPNCRSPTWPPARPRSPWTTAQSRATRASPETQTRRGHRASRAQTAGSLRAGDSWGCLHSQCRLKMPQALGPSPGPRGEAPEFHRTSWKGAFRSL